MRKNIHRKAKITPLFNRNKVEAWLADDNLLILKGMAMQCRTHEDLADMIGISRATLHNWRTKHPEIEEAVSVGREEADCAVIGSTFDDAIRGDSRARELWWKYRIASEKPETANQTIEKIQALADILKNPVPERELPKDE